MLIALDLNPDSHIAMCLNTFGSTPYCPENLSIKPFTSSDVAAVGVGEGIGVGFGFSFFTAEVLAILLGVTVALTLTTMADGEAIISPDGLEIGVTITVGIATPGLTVPSTFCFAALVNA